MKKRRAVFSHEKKNMQFRDRIVTPTNIVLFLFLLYQLNDYVKHYNYHKRLHEIYVHISQDGLCMSQLFETRQNVQVVTVSYEGMELSCASARELAKKYPLMEAFTGFVESKYVYKIITMDSWMIQVLSIIAIMWSMWLYKGYSVSVYQTDRMALPYHFLPKLPTPSHKKKSNNIKYLQ